VGAFRDDTDPGARGKEDQVQARQAADPLGVRSGARVVFDGKFTEGRDGYLFMADDNNQVMAQHSGLVRLDDAQLDGWRRVLESRTELLAGHGCAHLVMIAPDNHSVYPEKLPEAVEPVRERPVHQLMAHLDRSGSPVKIIYPLDELLAEKRDHQVCSRVDSHWSDYGAFLAYMRLMQDARPLVPTRRVDMEDVLFVDVVVQGDLGEKMDPPRSATQEFARMRNRFARLAYDNCVEGTGALAASACEVAPPTTCLLLGDSYAYYLLAFLSECWRRLVLVHAPTLDTGVVEAAQPDIAVSVIAERYLVAVPDDANGPPMCDREREKREEGRVRHPLMYWSWPKMLSASPVEQMRARLLREGRTRDAAFVGVLAYAGLRPAEAMALRWSAIGDDSIVVEPLPRARAAGSRPRQVPLWPPLGDDLEAWRRESDGGGRRFVFFAPGKPWGVDLQDWRTNVYPELARDVGIDDLAPSQLRTVYCALLIDAGFPVENVAELADIEAATVENGFRGLLMHARRSPWRPVDQAIAKARTAVAGLAETPVDSREAVPIMGDPSRREVQE
jgi:alginate O-acetyltransferase complex protein AlgJ